MRDPRVAIRRAHPNASPRDHSGSRKACTLLNVRTMRLQLTLVTAALFLACAAEETVTARGVVLQMDGGPLVDAPLTFTIRNPPPRTDDAGRYELSVPASQVSFTDDEHPDPIAREFYLGVKSDTGSTSADFTLTSGDRELPPLYVWNPDLAMHDEDGGLAITFAPYPDSSLLQTLSFTHSQNPFWVASGAELTDGRVTVRPEIFEDFAPARLALFASSPYSQRDGGVSISSNSYVQLDAGSFVPLSRGATCRRADEPAFRPCSLTDADPDLGSMSSTQLSFDLGRPVDPRLVILRRLSTSGRTFIEGSVDGGEWTILQTAEPGSGGWLALDLDAGTSLQLYRVRAESGTVLLDGFALF